ncbi:MAG: alkaline phosphatase family protein, partial [Polyangiaceae bacterium]
MLNRFPLFIALTALPIPFIMGCSSDDNPGTPVADGGMSEGGPMAEGGGGDAGTDAAASPPSSNIKHVVIIIQENHTFDSYFGTYCTAPTGSNPTCTAGPACCEAAPAMAPGDGGAAPVVLNDTENGAYDPNHTQSAELVEMNGGSMDKYLPRNVAYADPAVIAPYRAYAAAGALADRYFQPVVGQSSSNDMYFARAKFVFLDNTATPEGISARCNNGATPTTYPDKTLGDFLIAGGVPFAFYAEGYGAAVTATATDPAGCPAPHPDCSIGLASYPCIYDPGDDPFAYYATTRDNPAHMHDYSQFATDLAGTLPAVSYVKALGFKTEHP